MEYRDTRPRSGVPLSQIVIALFLAASAGGGLWFWLTNKNAISASAELAFDPTLAQRLDPDLTRAGHPALALANSILTDQAIASLAKEQPGATTTAGGRIGEFRSNLELTQPSPTLLRVRFLGNDADRSAANANAVALALTQWTPTSADPAADAQPASPSDPPAQPASPPDPPAQTAGRPAQSANPPAQSAGTVPMTGQSHPPTASPADHAISDSLGQISAQLAATDRQLDRLAGESGGGRSNPEAAYTEYNQQKLLRAQVGAAQAKLNGLRAQAGQAGAGSDLSGRIGAIQQALASILHTGSSAQSAGARGFGAAGTSADQLVQEREGLTRAISVIDKERQAIAQTELASSASNGSSQAASAPASAPPASTQPPASSQQAPPADSGASAPLSSAQTPPSAQQTPPADPGASTPPQLSQHPLSLLHMASPTPPAPLWPPILAALVCGLLYLGGAARVYSRYSDEENYEDYYDDEPAYSDRDEPAYPKRFITPGPEAVAPPAAAPPAAAPPVAPPTAQPATKVERHGQQADARDAFAKRIDSIVSDQPIQRANVEDAPVASEPPVKPVEQTVEQPAETRDASTRRTTTPAAPVQRTSEQATVQDAPATHAEPALPAAKTDPVQPGTTSRKPEAAPPLPSPQKADTGRRAAFLWGSSDEPSIHAQEEPQQSHSETGQPEPREEMKEDSFTDRLRKSLSQTEIGRQFEKDEQDAVVAPVSENR